MVLAVCIAEFKTCLRFWLITTDGFSKRIETAGCLAVSSYGTAKSERQALAFKLSFTNTFAATIAYGEQPTFKNCAFATSAMLTTERLASLRLNSASMRKAQRPTLKRRSFPPSERLLRPIKTNCLTQFLASEFPRYRVR